MTDDRATPASTPASTAYVRFVLVMMMLVMLINSVDRTVLSILIQDIQDELSIGDRQMGWLLGPAFTVFYLIASFPLASFADGGRRRLVISVGLFFWSLFTTLTALVTGFWSLFALRMGVGIGEASASAPGQSLISSYVPPERRSRSLSVIAIGSVFGLAIGMLSGGYVSETLGWRMAFVVAGVPGIVFSVVFFATVREPERPERSVSWIETLRYMGSVPTYRWIVAGQSTALFASMGRNLWEPTFLRRVYDMSALESASWYLFTSPLPSALGIFLGGWFADRLWKRDPRWSMWVPTIGQLASMPFLAAFLLWPETDRIPLLGIAGGMPVALLFSVFASVIGSWYAAPMLSTTQGLSPVAMRARAAALASAIGAMIGNGFGPLAVGDLSERLATNHGDHAIRYALLLVVATTAISALCWLGASRHVRDDFVDRDDRAD